LNERNEPSDHLLDDLAEDSASDRFNNFVLRTIDVLLRERDSGLEADAGSSTEPKPSDLSRYDGVTTD
jgi:hypothetical protein